MGNLKNRAKRNKRNANNWRGIIKMRKSKKGNLKVGQKETNDSNFSEHEIHNDSLENYGQALESNELRNNEISDGTPIDLEANVPSVPVEFDEMVEVDYSCNEESQPLHQVPFFLSEHNYCTRPDSFKKQCQSGTNQNNAENEVGIIEGIIDVENFASESQFNILDEVDVRSDKNASELASGFAGENNLIDGNESPTLADDDDDDNETDHQRMGAANITVKVTGRRIVDMNFLFNQIKYLNQHNEHSDECNFNDMQVVKETKMGLRTIFTFRCQVCGIEQRVTTCERDMEGMNVNKAAVLGITSVGCGFYNMEEFFAHLDIPCMSDKTFQKNNKELQGDWWQLAQCQADAALKEEIRLAIASGNVDSKGNALIIVITDGSWGKRSYGKGYSSLSGCAVLIGYRTQKIIYVGVKNKYCQTCANAYANMCPPNDHPCNINYEGPSSGMETAIIVEGFKHCATLGARFPILVADGDASTFKELRELRLYNDPVVIIQKYECINHLFKNFRKKFKALGFNTKYNSQNRKYMTPSKGNEICLGIRMAMKHWQKSDVDQSEKFTNLEKDCMNAPLHYFGQHDNYNSYFCEKKTTPESVELISLLKTDKIFHAVLGLCQDYFASNVKSLLAGYDTNVAEGFNSLVAKFLGGKRINYSLAGSYQGRVGMAVVQFNTEYHGGSEFHKANFDRPLDSCATLENRRKRKLKANAVAREKKPRRKPVYDNEASRVGYGEGCQISDKTGRAFELAVESELAKLEESRENRESILKDTIDRENCAKWHEVRQNIIGSFYFPRIINANNPKSYTKLTYEMLYNPKEFAMTAERKHYKINEAEALNAFCSMYSDYDLEKCGIFIDKELCFLGSTPLRLYGPESIITVRCPLKCFNQSVDEAINSKVLNFWKRKRGSNELFVNVKSAWYLEIQGELHVSDRKIAYLVVWLGEGKFQIEKIERDDELWESRMKPKLTFFFNESLLKELADSRRNRKMQLREFDPLQNTFV